MLPALIALAAQLLSRLPAFLERRAKHNAKREPVAKAPPKVAQSVPKGTAGTAPPSWTGTTSGISAASVPRRPRWWQWRRRRGRQLPKNPPAAAPFQVISVLRGPLSQPVGLAAPLPPAAQLPPGGPGFSNAAPPPPLPQLQVAAVAAAVEAAASAEVSVASGNPGLAAIMSTPAIRQLLISQLFPSIPDLIALTCTSRAAWSELAALGDIWRELYLLNEPLSTPEFRKIVTGPKYAEKHAATLLLPLSGLVQSVWLRTCCLLYNKPQIVLVLGGKDPVFVRRLGQPEAEAESVSLGINYHLDDFLDDEERRFSVEFPQLFQELNVGDLVITQDYKGAGCWTALLDPAAEPSPAPYLVLKRNGHDTAGYGILGAEVAPPHFPLFYYCDVEFSSDFDRRSLKGREVYWYAYTRLKCRSLYSWAEQEIFEDDAF